MTTQQLPKFLVIRFAPGGAGNFLASLLQCSHGIGHWVEELEHSKPTVDWLTYFKNVFVPDLSQWLVNEPVGKQDLGTREIFSAMYNRGNNFTIDEFAEQEQQHCSNFYFELKNKQDYIPIFWHKNYFPAYFANATFINIMLDQASIRWFDRSYYKKHYAIDQLNLDGSLVVRYERHRPSIVPKTFSGQNQYKNYHPSFINFARTEIFGNIWRKRYVGQDYLANSTNGQPNFTLALSDLLNLDQLTPTYFALCNFLNIDPMPGTQLTELFLHWRQCHDY